MRVLVLGAYGLIGLAIAARLRSAKWPVVGLGRSKALGCRLAPEIDWLEGDLRHLTTPDDWLPILGNVDAVVNAAGALQEGVGDNLSKVHFRSICALIAACRAKGIRRYVQISAPGADAAARLPFLRTKGQADASIRESGLDWTILKPGLVVGANAYGGTSLIRSMAAFPLVMPLVFGKCRLHTVAVTDLADAVFLALSREQPLSGDFDLMEARPRALCDIVTIFRKWLGFSEARAQITLPAWLGFLLAYVGDLMSWTGWRSPLRTTTMRVLAGGVLGNPAPWVGATGQRFRSLEETLDGLPATRQERVYSRAMLVFPFLVCALLGYWIREWIAGLLSFGITGIEAGRDLGLTYPPLIASLSLVISVMLIVRPWLRIGAWFILGLHAVSWLGWTAYWALDLAFCFSHQGPGGVLVNSLNFLAHSLPMMALAVAVAALAESR